MTSLLDSLYRSLLDAPDALVYAALALAAALENVVPPIPADVVVLFGGLLAGRGSVSVVGVFLAVWLANVAGALLVYGIGRRYGLGFFAGRWGRILLRPKQLRRLQGFYRRHGFGVILISRFLPMFRAVVPVFAGVARIGFWRTALPVALASAAWYGAIVLVGAAAGRNWEAIVSRLDEAGRWLWMAAALVGAGVAVWWWRTRDDD